MTTIVSRARTLTLISCMFSAGLSAQQPLTLRDAIQAALSQNPDIATAQASANEARAGLAIAKTMYLPQINFAEDISRGDDPVYVFGTRLRQQRFTQADFSLDALNKPDAIGNYATRVSGNWLLFDSLHTQHLVRGAKLIGESADASATAAQQRVVFDVVQAYQGVLYAERQVEIAQHELETAQALFSSVDDHVKAGLTVDSDRMAAQVSVAAREEALITAKGDQELAWAQLGVAMGTPDIKQSALRPIEPKAFPDDDLEQEVRAALENRKDLAALVHGREAQGAAESAARLNFGPRVSTYGNWEDDRQTFAGNGGNNWVAGVQVSIDILPFGKRAQLAKEKASSARLDSHLKSYQQQIRLQVDQAHIRRKTAALTLETTRSAIDQATESLRIVQNRYSAGIATITDLLRAEDSEREARMNYWHAVYGNVIAYAQLLFATGTLTPDAAEDLQ